MATKTVQNTIVAPIATPVTVPINHGEKLEKFNRTEFKRWQQKILFYLTTQNLVKFLYKDARTLNENEVIGKQLLLQMHGNMQSFCVRIIFLMDWTTHCTMCIVKRSQESCGTPWTRRTEQKMLEPKSSLWVDFWITKCWIPRL